MKSHLQLRTDAAMKAAWERAATSQERTISDWARRALNDAAGYREEGMQSGPVAQTPPAKLAIARTPPERESSTIPAAACARRSTHRRGVFCKACGRTP